MLVFLHRDVKNLYFFSDLKKVLAFEEGWAYLPWKPGNVFWFKKTAFAEFVKDDEGQGDVDAV